jgi:SAGA-associated factor 29
MPARPASSEGVSQIGNRKLTPQQNTPPLEVECWTHATDSLKILSSVYAKPSTLETIGRVNRLISTWPTDDTLPAEGLAALKMTQSKLAFNLSDISNTAEQETR